MRAPLPLTVLPRRAAARAAKARGLARGPARGLAVLLASLGAVTSTESAHAQACLGVPFAEPSRQERLAVGGEFRGNPSAQSYSGVVVGQYRGGVLFGRVGPTFLEGLDSHGWVGEVGGGYSTTVDVVSLCAFAAVAHSRLVTTHYRDWNVGAVFSVTTLTFLGVGVSLPAPKRSGLFHTPYAVLQGEMIFDRSKVFTRTSTSELGDEDVEFDMAVELGYTLRLWPVYLTAYARLARLVESISTPSFDPLYGARLGVLF